MRNLPSGTVTFLFTDIEGSTRLLDEHGEGYAELLAEHRSVLRDAFSSHGGVEVDTQGDAFFVAFGRAADAVAAAEAAQRELDIPVRMGIHTGEPQVSGGGYVGMDVHRAARIAAAAHGRQVVVSERAAASLDSNEGLTDLGLHRLKDLGEPVKLYQLGDDQFPPLRTLNATNLPAQPSRLVGRERELAELQALVRDGARAVTLTGPGGSGKTRLALQAAAELVDEFADGVFWVPLAALTDPELVLPTIGQTLGAKVPLREHVDEKRMLLLLDNLEQVIECAASLSELLERCPNLQLLVTSRTLLRVAGERDYPVEPLPEDDAVTLFRERAAVSEPLDAVEEICRRLDGLPLALELAAARTRLLPPDKLLERLDKALPVLTGGRRDAPERQRTLRATIEWSYELLDEDEKQLFRRLAVFAGGFSVEAAEQVAGADLETLESLLDQSLVRRWESGRLGMLETIREYADELLEASDEANEYSRRHLQLLIAVARRANLTLEDSGPMEHALVVPERDNIRAALNWAARTRQAELGLELTTALENYWVSSGDPREGKHWLDAFLAIGSVRPELHALALRALGNSAAIAGARETAVALYERSLDEFRALGDEPRIAVGLSRVAFNVGDEDPARARVLAEEALDRYRRTGLLKGEAQILTLFGGLEQAAGNLEAAIDFYEQSIEPLRQTGFAWWEQRAHLMRAETYFELERPGDARKAALDACEVAQRIHDRFHTVHAIALVARAVAEEGDERLAGRLWGAVEAEDERDPIPSWADERDAVRGAIVTRVGSDFDAAVSEGRALSLGEAVEEARARA